MARLLAEGTGATDATVWLRVDAEMRPAATWPVPAQPRTPIASDDDGLPAFPDVDAAVAVRRGSDLLGALTITKPPSDPILPEEDKLLGDLAAQAGLVLDNFRLDRGPALVALAVGGGAGRGTPLSRTQHPRRGAAAAGSAGREGAAGGRVGRSGRATTARGARTASSTTRRARWRTCATWRVGSIRRSWPIEVCPRRSKRRRARCRSRSRSTTTVSAATRAMSRRPSISRCSRRSRTWRSTRTHPTSSFVCVATAGALRSP